MTLLVVVLVGCEGGWSPSPSREAATLWQLTRHCEVTMASATAIDPKVIGRPTVTLPRARLDGALAAFARTAECDDDCPAQARAVQARTSAVDACRGAAALLRAHSIAGYDREPELKDAARLWLRWFLSSYWTLVALAVAVALIAGKLEGDDAIGLVGAAAVLFPAARALAAVPALFWIGFALVVAAAVGIGLVVHLKATRPRALAGIEFVLGLVMLGLGLTGLVSLRGQAGTFAAVGGVLGSILTCGHALSAMGAARAAPREG